MPEGNGKDYIIGVDLGATKISCGVFDTRLTLLGFSKLSTKADRGPETVVARIARCVTDAVDECDLSLKQVRAVGVGAPGIVSSPKGEIIYASNLEWENVDLQDRLEAELRLPIFVENDGNVCTLAVYAHELKSKPQNLLGMFIGGGIGGGLIVNGRLFSGMNHGAVEVGHMVINIDGPKCPCGRHGCLEALAGRRAIFRRIEAAIKDGQKTVLTEMEGGIKQLRSRDLRKAIKKGDKYVENVVEEAARYIGLAVGNLLNFIGPEVVVLGGGVIEALESEMLPVIKKAAREQCLRGTSEGVEIFTSQLGDNAGIVGAAVLARLAARENSKN